MNTDDELTRLLRVWDNILKAKIDAALKLRLLSRIEKAIYDRDTTQKRHMGEVLQS